MALGGVARKARLAKQHLGDAETRLACVEPSRRMMGVGPLGRPQARPVASLRKVTDRAAASICLTVTLATRPLVLLRLVANLRQARWEVCQELLRRLE